MACGEQHAGCFEKAMGGVVWTATWLPRVMGCMARVPAGQCCVVCGEQSQCLGGVMSTVMWVPTEGDEQLDVAL